MANPSGGQNGLSFNLRRIEGMMVVNSASASLRYYEKFDALDKSELFVMQEKANYFSIF